jgi:peptidoglycan/LPS O-acetylase OafA/YrhL
MSTKIIFANQLRGAAALCVVVNHWFGFYWRGRDVVATATATPVQPGIEPWIANLADSGWHNSGPLGVALFFLISGFVIPFSLEHHNRLSFLAARALRIYPVYFLAVAIDVAAILLSSHAWQLPAPLTSRQVLLNALLIQNLDWLPSIDMVNWTLAIEMKFYLAVALLFAPIRARRVWPLLALAVVVVPACWLLVKQRIGDGSPFYPALSMSAVDCAYLPFMVIGTAFKFHLEKALSTRGLVLTGAALAGLSLAAFSCQFKQPADALPTALNYLYALILFATAYGWREKFRPLAALDGLAAISYPLYAVHAILGYVLLKTLTLGMGLGFYPALAITALIVFPLAAALHVSAERFGIRAGRRLSRQP